MSDDDTHVAKALCDLAIFLEFADSQTLAEDASVQLMEQLAAQLKALSGPKRMALYQAWRKLSLSYSEPGVSRFVHDLSEHLGLGQLV